MSNNSSLDANYVSSNSIQLCCCQWLHPITIPLLQTPLVHVRLSPEYKPKLPHLFARWLTELRETLPFISVLYTILHKIQIKAPSGVPPPCTSMYLVTPNLIRSGSSEFLKSLTFSPILFHGVEAESLRALIL